MKVFANGKFVSCEQENRFFRVLITDKGKIVYTGDDIPVIYRKYPVQDMGGRCITPCFGDTHMHFISTCFLPLDVRDCTTIPQVLEKIKAYAKTNKERAVEAFGISAHIMKEKRLPTRAELDSASQKPVLLAKYDGHSGILNSALIELLPYRIQHNHTLNCETGECTGEAFQLLCNFFAAAGFVRPSFVMQNIPRVLNHLAQFGINLIMPVEGLENDASTYYLADALDGQTPIRVQTFFHSLDVDEAVARGCKRIGGCFVNQLDGCFGACDAALREPYTNNPQSKGWLLHSQSAVNEFIKKANRAGLHIAIHAIGDAAIEQLIIAFEQALEDYPRTNHRHAIIHADLFPKEYLERAGKLGLYCAVQTPFLTWPEEPLEYLQEIIGDRALEKHPLPLMINAGLTLCNGSDNPSSQVNPLMGLYSSCNHPNSRYSVDIITALQMHTLNAAKFAFLDKEMGSLTEGKRADFVVFDQDITTMPKDQLLQAKIAEVYYGAKRYEKPLRVAKLPLLWHVLSEEQKYKIKVGKRNG